MNPCEIGPPGAWIAIDGITGSGKTSQANWLEAEIRKRGHSTVFLRDPWEQDFGEVVATMIFEHNFVHKLPVASQMFLCMAARAKLFDEKILTALFDGKIVITDGSPLSTVAYFSRLDHPRSPMVSVCNAVATHGVCPDITFVLDVPASAAMERIDKHDWRMERFDGYGEEYLERARGEFRRICELPLRERQQGDYCGLAFLIDGTESLDSVHNQIWTRVSKLLGVQA